MHRKVAAASAAVSRKKYREERAAQGLTVRPHTYHDHVPQQPHEHREDYEKRIHRDRERERRGVTAQTVRPYHDLSNMTEEEKAEHRRTQAKLRKANERKRKAEAKDSPIEPNVLEVGYASDPNFGRF
ncbi:hypothetical protein ASG03_12050 [Rhizobium sp. Leaf341]|nr:hypothetical protein ASG03_12050 [Rhizobium sp. Leaf341]